MGVQMKGKARWYSMLMGGLALLLVSSVTGCSQPEQPPTPIPAPSPEETVGWDKADRHISERTTVCGPVVHAKWDSDSEGKPTFLYLGTPFPHPKQFMVVIRIDYRANFPQPPETYYLGKTICVTGLIEQHNGIPQIEVKTPDQIEER